MEVDAESHRYVHRVQNAAFNGWRFSVSALGLQEWFSVSRYGGVEEALQAALTRRSAVFPEGVPYGKAQSASTRVDGDRLLGVHLYIDERGAPERKRIRGVYWEAVWGSQEKKRFSVRRLGWAQAFKSACRLRYAHTGYPARPDEVWVPDTPDRVSEWLRSRTD